MQETFWKNKWPIMIAFLQWGITTILQIDRLYFEYDYHTSIFYFVKSIYLLVLIIFWCFAFDVYKKVKSGNAMYKRGCQFFYVYFGIILVLLLILWPGTWSWDDAWMLETIMTYDSFCPWQHFFTGLYQDVMLQIFPFPAGIIFLQNFIISICVAFCVTKLENAFEIRKLKNGFWDIILKIMPFFLPPVLLYQFSGYRIGIYIYIELVMLVILICARKEQQEWSWKYIILFCLSCIIVSTWRTESFLYIPFSCFLLFFINEKILTKIKKIFGVIIILMGFWAMNSLQSYYLGNSNYQIISLLGPCTELVRVSGEEDIELLEDIDKVTRIDVIRDNPSMNGEQLYWNTSIIRPDYTKEDYNSYLKAFIKLSLKYPQTVISERWGVFVKGVGNETKEPSFDTAVIFDENSENGASEVFLSEKWVATMPIFENFRKEFIFCLSGRNKNGDINDILHGMIWNIMIPILVLVFAWLKCLISKQWYLFFVGTAILVRIPIIAITQPSGLFMYWLSFYLLGCVYIVYKIWINMSKKR